jgi:hypothetical protein
MGGKDLPSGAGFIDPNFPNPHGPDDARIIIYRYFQSLKLDPRFRLTLHRYTPDFALCVLGIVLFALVLLIHGIQVAIYRPWSCASLTIACLLEIVGYVFCSLSSCRDPYHITYFAVEYFLIVTAPVLVSTSIYVCLTHIIAWAEASGTNLGYRWWMKRKIILWPFISADIMTTVMQVTGAGMIGGATSKQKDPTTANNILLSGLVIRSVAF